MEEKRSHPILSVFGDTERLSFPIILIIGREPNDNVEMGHTIGRYEFGSGGVPFWDIPYSIIAEYLGLKGRELKSLCQHHNSSPIAFADISVKPICSNDKDKLSKRNEIQTEDFVNHLVEIESLPFFKRVELVVFAGLDYPFAVKGRYVDALNKIEPMWQASGIETIKVRFPIGNHRQKIKDVLDLRLSKFKEILGFWLSDTYVLSTS